MKDQGESSRRKIRTALKQLIEQNEPDDLKKPGFTVSELLSLAGVSRGTFYAYYSSLEDAFEDLIMEFSDQLVLKLRQGRKEVPGIQGYGRGYYYIVELIHERPTLFRVMFHHRCLEQKFLDTIQEYTYQQYLVEFPDEDPELLRYTAISNTYFIYGMLIEWEKDDFRKSPDEIASLMGNAMRLSKRIDALY